MGHRFWPLSKETVYEHRLLHRVLLVTAFSLRIYGWIYDVLASVLHHNFGHGERISHSDFNKDNTAFIDSTADKILALKTKYLVPWLVGWLDFLYIVGLPALKLCTCVRHQ